MRSKFLLLACAFSFFTSAVVAQLRSENRERTPQEDAFYKKIHELIRQSLPRNNYGKWEVVNETANDEHILPGFETPKNKGPYYYNYTIELMRNGADYAKGLDSIAQEITKHPNDATIVQRMEEYAAGATCKIVVDVNQPAVSSYYCGGKVSYPKTDLIKQAFRVEMFSSGGPNCNGSTTYLIGAFEPHKVIKEGSAGTITSKALINKTASPFLLHNVTITITAPPSVADYFISKINVAALAKSINQVIQ